MTRIPSNVERVVWRPEGAKRSRSVRLVDVRETTIFGQPAITGSEVDADGVLVDPDARWLAQHGATSGTKVHIIETALVEQRVPQVTDLTYGTLVDA